MRQPCNPVTVPSAPAATVSSVPVAAISPQPSHTPTPSPTPKRVVILVQKPVPKPTHRYVAPVIRHYVAPAPPVHHIPQSGAECGPGDSGYAVCQSHDAWVGGQVDYMNCINSGHTWNVARQVCNR